MPQALRDATQMRSFLLDQRRMRPSGADAVCTPTVILLQVVSVCDTLRERRDGSSLGVYVKKIDEEELSLNPTY